MHFRYFLSAPRGSIEFGPDDLARPFLVSPEEKHPFLLLKDYFSALRKFILLDNGRHLESILVPLGGGSISSLADISEIRISSEKHGAFYHIASIVLVSGANKVKLALSTALSESAKQALKNEFSLMQQLSAAHPEFLPKLFYGQPLTWQTHAGTVQFYMVLGEWLNDYHEWHVSRNPAAERQQIHLWDYDRGYRFLSEQESYELLRQAAYILTCFYDQDTFCQVYPWHHGAGDFVVKADHDDLRVKLITVRGYEPLIDLEQTEEHACLTGLIHFLLNLSLRIRLDRLNGINEPAWLEEYAVWAAVAGFWVGLDVPAKAKSSTKVAADEFFAIMQNFETNEIYEIYTSLVALYADENPDDLRLIQEKLWDHSCDLQIVLREFSPP